MNRINEGKNLHVIFSRDAEKTPDKIQYPVMTKTRHRSSFHNLIKGIYPTANIKIVKDCKLFS